jgi:hypothetical protein
VLDWDHYYALILPFLFSCAIVCHRCNQGRKRENEKWKMKPRITKKLICLLKGAASSEAGASFPQYLLQFSINLGSRDVS